MVNSSIFVNGSQRLYLQAAIGAVGLLFANGCASIMNGRQANVAIDSYPSNAHVVIHDQKGREVASVTTPGVVSLKRNTSWLMPARYTATIEAPGYQTAEVPIHSTVNPWILGNVVVGGIPGLIVDDATGACWKPDHDSIHQQLVPAAYAQQSPAVPVGQAASQVSAQVPAIPLTPVVATSGIAPASETPASPSVARGPSAPAMNSFYR
jgi:hypothetical protein